MDFMLNRGICGDIVRHLIMVYRPNGQELEKGINMRISKAKWHKMGGFRNSYLYRKQATDCEWTYHTSDNEMAKKTAGRIAGQRD